MRTISKGIGGTSLIASVLDYVLLDKKPITNQFDGIRAVFRASRQNNLTLNKKEDWRVGSSGYLETKLNYSPMGSGFTIGTTATRVANNTLGFNNLSTTYQCAIHKEVGISIKTVDYLQLEQSVNDLFANFYDPVIPITDELAYKISNINAAGVFQREWYRRRDSFFDSIETDIVSKIILGKGNNPLTGSSAFQSVQMKNATTGAPTQDFRRMFQQLEWKIGSGRYGRPFILTGSGKFLEFEQDLGFLNPSNTDVFDNIKVNSSASRGFDVFHSRAIDSLLTKDDFILIYPETIGFEHFRTFAYNQIGAAYVGGNMKTFDTLYSKDGISFPELNVGNSQDEKLVFDMRMIEATSLHPEFQLFFNIQFDTFTLPLNFYYTSGALQNFNGIIHYRAV